MLVSPGRTLWAVPWQQATLEDSSTGACQTLWTACTQLTVARSLLSWTIWLQRQYKSTSFSILHIGQYLVYLATHLP